MSTLWGKTFVSFYDRATLGLRSVIDEGINVNFLNVLSSSGTFERSAQGNGQAVIHMHDRRAYPLVRTGDIAVVYIHNKMFAAANSSTNGNLIIAGFIVEDINPNDTPTGEGATMTISGATLDKEFDQVLVPTDIHDGNGGKALDDLAQLISFGPAGWSIINTYGGARSGSSTGSILTPQWGSIAEMFRRIVERSGDNYTWRDVFPPQRKLRWTPKNQYRDTGYTIVNATKANAAAAESDWTLIIPTRISRKILYADAVTSYRVEGGGMGNETLTLAVLEEGDVEVPAGYRLHYQDSILVNETAEATLNKKHMKRKSWSYILPKVPEGKEEDEVAILAAEKEAAKQLFDVALESLKIESAKHWEYDVECTVNGHIWPGDRIACNYSKSAGGQVLWALPSHLYVQRVSHSSQASTSGRRTTNLSLVDTFIWLPPESAEDQIADKLKEIDDRTRGVNAAPATGGVTSAPGDHHTLINLHLNDHPQYLQRAGGTMYGPLVLGQGAELRMWDSKVGRVRRLVLEGGALRWEDL